MKKILSITLSLIIVSCCFLCGNSAQKNPEVFAGNTGVYEEFISAQTVYDKLIAMKEEYPDGMKWTNENSYIWNGSFRIGNGCVAFAYILSDSVFGNLRARMHTDLSQVKAGDIIRLNNNTHSVIVLKRDDNILTVAEGNFAASIRWGRRIDINDSSNGFNYVLTRYPKCGDIDGDDVIDSADASLVLAEYAALSTSSPSGFDDRKKWAADIDGDGKIDSTDASYILAFYAYLTTSDDMSQIDIRQWRNDI